MWVGTSNGPWILADEAFAHYEAADGFRASEVWSTSEIDGVLWAGTTEGCID